MKCVFPLFNNIEVLIYPNNRLYSKSYCIYLISDLNYKIMFLNEYIYTGNTYMIYDEIDTIANPLTCELNKPNETKKQELTLINDLFTLANELYTILYSEEETEFWKHIEKKYHNGVHYYIYDISTINYEKIIAKIDISTINANLINYVKKNILIFILTKQFNFDYGLPEEYNLDALNSYKFKAIPYSAVDSPIIGSEFSDSILTYILTLFCYKFVKYKFRKIDKTYIVEYYSKLYETSNDEKYSNILSKFFTITTPSFEYIFYTKNKEYYMDNYNDIFNIADDFDIIITKILNMNTTYYETCKNIAFTDLLLTRYVKKFVCFTGTAYIIPPEGGSNDKNFDHDNIITKYMINDKSIEDTVKDIINNTSIILKIYNNRTNNLIKNIFECLSKYQVLIDIGGIFINYNITKFIEEYKKTINPKNYIVYFNNGRKIKNLITDQFETEQVINLSENNTFFFFSNKDITGVDAKDIMNWNVHALVVITNNTNMRDFSQGIFRLRNLLENDKHETFDIIFDALFNKENILNEESISIDTDSIDINSINIDINKEPISIVTDFSIENNDKCFKLTDQNIRKYIIASLTQHQEIIDKQKTQALIKQNIFALIKRNLYTSEDIVLFIDPIKDNYEKIKIRFDELKTDIQNFYEIVDLSDYKFNINNYNILNICDITSNQDYSLYKLFLKYFDLVISDQNTTGVTTNITKQTEENTILVTIADTNDYNYSGRIDPSFRYSVIVRNTEIQTYEIQTNKILCLYKHDEELLEKINRYDMLLVYDNNNKTLIILSIDQLMRFLMYNNINNNVKYSFISLNNDNVYGKSVETDFKIYLISQASEIFKKIKNIDIKYLNKLLLNLSTDSNEKYTPLDDDKLTLRFMNKYIHKNLYYAKYIKYKDKYLNLINKNI